DFAEKAGKSARDASGAASDFEHPHVFGIFVTAYIRQIVQNLIIERDHAGFEKLLVRPLVLPGDDVVARIFASPAIPVAAHPEKLSGDLKAGHLLYCSYLPTWAASSAGRARRSQCRGRGFDPPAVHQSQPAPPILQTSMSFTTSPCTSVKRK